jgi:hypothetical protein
MNSFDKIELNTYTEYGFERINLDRFYKPLSDFMNNYSPLEFPVFCLNFDYMRILTTVVQSKVGQYVHEFQKLEKLLSNTQIPKADRHPRTPLKCLVSRSVSPPRKIDIDTLEKGDSKFAEVVRKREISIKPRRFPNNLSKDEFLDISMKKLIKKNAKPIYEKALLIIDNTFKKSLLKQGLSKLITSTLYEKLYIFITKISNTEKKISYRFKRHFFFLLINKLIKSHEADGIYKFKLKRQFLDNLRMYYYNRIDMSRAKYENSLKVKIFYTLVKNYYDKEYLRNKAETINSFYNDRLKYKALYAFKLLQSNKFLKSDSLAYSRSVTGESRSRYRRSEGNRYNTYNIASEGNVNEPNNPYDDIYDEINQPNDYRYKVDPKMNTNQLEFKHFDNNITKETPSDTFLDKTDENIFDNNLVKGSEVDELLSKLEEKYKSLSNKSLT